MPLPPLILCPLAHEAALLHRLAPALPRAHVVGPGRGVGASLGTLAAPGQLVLLVGTAGGLRRPWCSGRAALAIGVRGDRAGRSDRGDEDHGEHRPPLALRLVRDHGLPGASVATVERPVIDPADKARLAAALDADLVDCESLHFARAAEARGCPWLVVRGVSDGPSDALPPQVGRWIDERGRTRLGRVFGDLLRSPSLLAALPRLSRASRASMQAAAALVDEALRQWSAGEGSPGGEACRTSTAPALAASAERPLEAQP